MSTRKRRTAEEVPGQLALPLIPPAYTPTLDRSIPAGWETRGACASINDAGYFPDPDAPDGVDPGAIGEAKRVCCTCPVRDACRATGLLDPDLQGIWGGTTENERDDLRSELSAGLPVIQALTRTYLDVPHTSTPARETRHAA